MYPDMVHLQFGQRVAGIITAIVITVLDTYLEMTLPSGTPEDVQHIFEFSSHMRYEGSDTLGGYNGDYIILECPYEVPSKNLFNDW
jgi:hypothetical protein